MRVLFLYNDAIHAWPLLRSVEAAAALGIEIDAHEEHDPDAVSRYRAADFDTMASCSRWDCLLIHQELMSEAAIEFGKPVIILERIDGAQLGTSRRWLGRVAAVLKGYTYWRRRLNNEFRGRVHAHVLRGAHVDPQKKSCAVLGIPEPIPDADLEKIHAFYGFGAYKKQADLLAINPDLVAPRSTAVHFAGTVAYSGTEIETHRRLAARVCRGIRGGMGLNGRLQRPHIYYQSLLESRAVVSPWGWGEACYRDYEAWILGCALIKPDTDYVLGWPSVYHGVSLEDWYCQGATYFKCRPDFRDVPQIVARIADSWNELQPMREDCRRLAEQAADPAGIAGRLKEILESVL